MDMFLLNFTPKEKQYGQTDDNKLTEIHYNVFYLHVVIVSVVCPLLQSWKSSYSLIVPSVRGIRFVSKALLASYGDFAAG